MNPSRMCANLSWLFTEESNLLKRFSLARKRGFKWVELGFPYEHEIADVVKAKEEAGVEVFLINSGSGKTLGSAADPSGKVEFERELTQAIKYASALRCRGIHLMAGRGERSAEATETFVENLKMAAPRLAEHDLMGLVEPINRFDVPGYFLNDHQQGVEIVERVGAENIRLQFDFYHQHLMEGGLMSKFAAARHLIGHVQISQVPGRKEPFGASGGEIDYGYVFGALSDAGYGGLIGLEYKPSSDTLTSLEWFKP